MTNFQVIKDNVHFTIKAKCGRCLKDEDITVRVCDFYLWKHGILMQHAFPYLNDGQREILISGICSDCFDQMFNEEPYEVFGKVRNSDPREM